MGADEKQLSIRSGAFMIVVGLGAFGYFGWVLCLQLRAAAWPTTDARVVTSHVEVQTTVSAKRGIRDIYLGKVAFQYSVAGQTHESSELWFDSKPMGTREEMAKLTGEYPKGKTIQVYYDPANPGRAVVQPEKNGLALKIGALIGICSLLIGVPVLLRGLAAKTAESSASEGDLVAVRPRNAHVSSTTVTPAVEAKSSYEPTASEPASKSPKPWHWSVRLLAGIVGVPTFLLFGLVTLRLVSQCFGPQGDQTLASMIIGILIAGGVTLFGLWLTITSFRRRQSNENYGLS